MRFLKSSSIFISRQVLRSVSRPSVLPACDNILGACPATRHNEYYNSNKHSYDKDKLEGRMTWIGTLTYIDTGWLNAYKIRNI